MAARSRPGPAGFGIRRAGSFAGKTFDLGVVVDSWMGTGTTTSTGIQKPGIPAGTDPWLKTTLEILMGRRGNAIDVPEMPDITFSSTPTQDECQALYDANKTTRDLLRQLKDRFDS